MHTLNARHTVAAAHCSAIQCKSALFLQISNPQHAPPPDHDTEAGSGEAADDNGPSTSNRQTAATASGHKLVPDGQMLHVQGELLILAVGNGRQAGGGMRLCPYAGWFHFLASTYMIAQSCDVPRHAIHLLYPFSAYIARLYF